MNRIQLILTLTLLFLPQVVISLFGCTCMPPYYYNFKDALTLHPLFTTSNKAIILGIIMDKSINNYFITVESIETITGSIPGKVLTIAGQDGINCGMELSSDEFGLNDTLVLCLTSDFYNREDTLELSGCSLSYLSFSDKFVQGNIARGIQEMLYDDFKTFVLSGFVLPVNNIRLNNDQITFSLRLDLNELVIIDPHDYFTSFRVYDLSGRTVSSGFLKNNCISISNLKAGMYGVHLGNSQNAAGFIKLVIPGIRPPPT